MAPNHLRESSFECSGCLSSAFNKPPAYAVAGLIWTSLEKQVALLALDVDGIAVALASSSHRGSLTDIGNAVDLILSTVFPGDLPRKHDAILSEVDLDLNINFYAVT